MPRQLEAPIAQGGTNVSGGQRQRLSIARALVKKPEIYIFDDSFSALDVATDARLRAALKRETTDACVIIVGQRVATIADADKIVVLEHGEVVGSGTHDELLGRLPDVRRDRRLSAECRGGGRMSERTETLARRRIRRPFDRLRGRRAEQGAGTPEVPAVAGLPVPRRSDRGREVAELPARRCGGCSRSWRRSAGS